ncbi:hypothetical protein [Pseudonocardia lacus]|uniref:hypothetical protein n=1 Tax=Pseudonocardia lacus TaxID=2835865 RepID=UPI0027E388FA|nr:hypothetical protein [Pseudonocardia lacus]
MSQLVLLACPGGGLADHNGSPRPIVRLPARPGRDDVDPVLAEHEPRRVAVAGTDADLAAVLLRLLRTERLDVEVAYLPTAASPATRAWGLPTGRAAVDLAGSGTARPVPLVRDDGGGVLVGRGEVRDLTGECYCDEVLVLRGSARRLVVVPGPDGIAVRAGWGGRAPDGRVRPVPPKARTGRGSSRGRAVQVGGRPFTVTADGVEHPRPLPRRTWYRHTDDWLLVRP